MRKVQRGGKFTLVFQLVSGKASGNPIEDRVVIYVSFEGQCCSRDPTVRDQDRDRDLKARDRDRDRNQKVETKTETIKVRDRDRDRDLNENRHNKRVKQSC